MKAGTIHKSNHDTRRASIETTLSYVLIIGVALSFVIILSGWVLYFFKYKTWDIEYSLSDQNLLSLAAHEFSLLIHRISEPKLIINLGIVVLMLTPFLRVLSSVILFAVYDKNIKYAVITLFVLLVLSWSLFWR